MSDEQLLAARAEIEAILVKRNIAGHVVLHAPGFIEMFAFYEPSYSKIKQVRINDNEFAMHIRSKLEDYNGDTAAQQRDLEATAGMVRGIGEALAMDAIVLVNYAGQIDAQLDARHTGLVPVTRPKGTTQ